MGKLSQEQLDAALASLPEWNLLSGQLVREWTFPRFVEAMAFTNRVAEFAEALNHHPDIDIRYNRVRLALVTHDAGGITERDIRFATDVPSRL